MSIVRRLARSRSTAIALLSKIGSRRQVWGVLLALLPLLAGCLVDAPPTVPPVVSPPTATGAPAVPPAGGRIAFLSTRNDGMRELYVVNADGSHETRLLPGRLMVGAPVWSPDGTRLAYVMDVSGKAQIGVLLVNADNTPGQTAVLTADAQTSDNTNPAWSPDGRQLAFQSTRNGGSQIFVMPSVGGTAQTYPNSPPTASGPAWSPDGRTLIFSGGRDAQHAQLYSVPAAGGQIPAPITNTDLPAVNPIWMPDGKSLLFLLTTVDGRHTIAAIRPDGSGQHDLTSAPAGQPTAPPGGRPTACAPEDLYPQPSPDGKWVAFFSERACNEDVFITDSAGASLTNLTNSPTSEVSPSWAPDSFHLVYSANRDGSYRLYTQGRDGSGLTPLTQGDGDYDDSFPTWAAVR